MIPTKAYILKTTDSRSVAYAKDVADSCDKIGLQWEYLDWYHGKPDEAWKNTGVPKPPNISGNAGAQCCFSGHIAIWKKILDSGKAGIILEHDGMMLHPINIDIPDNMIVVLGYKLQNPNEYNHKEAGGPKEIIDVKGGGHEGSHTYAITPATADALLKEISTTGCPGAIDNRYFLKSRKTAIPIKIMSPTPAIGWIRESTIQGKSSIKNYEFIDSFKQYHTPSKVEKPKGNIRNIPQKSRQEPVKIIDKATVAPTEIKKQTKQMSNKERRHLKRLKFMETLGKK